MDTLDNYISPELKFIELTLESVIMTGSTNLEDPLVNPDTGW